VTEKKREELPALHWNYQKEVVQLEAEADLLHEEP
jgi:hypothetical protein